MRGSGGGGGFTRRSLLKAGGVAIGAAMVGPLGGCGRDDDPERRPATRAVGRPAVPNIVVVLADDMRFDELPFMPTVADSLAAVGTSFAAARHNIALCSPARAGFLTGQFARRHRVRAQSNAFRALNDESNTLPVWLERAGYHNAIVGKYFTAVEGGSGRLPGWALERRLAENGQQQRGFTVWDGERSRSPDVDQTRYLRDTVVEFLADAPEPFFLWFAPTANHYPFESPPGLEDAVATLEWPDTREEDVSDKPPWVQAMPPLTDDELRVVRENQRMRVRELLGLDATIADVLSTLEARGALDHTVVMFSSDNGILQGEHRVPPLTKNLPYEPSVHVPCVVRGPGFMPGTVSQAVHMSVDLTATCVDIAGAQPGLALDGVSLQAVAADPQSFDDRHLLYERDAARDDAVFACPAAVGVFTTTRKLVRYATEPPVYELYDLERDPREHENVADAQEYASDKRDLEAALDALLTD